ncbi:ankyrin repeat domain-containing protein [Vibrio sp. ZSDZ65]|uniref:Ankyrin repeat domain-containing protein n=1 Tax=Vibrio qingdaonensis TaxID=2829491 RepID=A0A9X3HZ24_9VIBR|nr:ankyrin repeat domain-containing protein [Vibrio qingdaonensis]MCW8348412.1 ankyrin repeat domain-containing protein [Vibrio qingdaonensis]
MKLLHKKRAKPYPTIQYLLREVAIAFDVKTASDEDDSRRAAKQLDDSCKVEELSIDKYHAILSLNILNPIRQNFDDEISARVENFLVNLLKRYAHWMRNYPLDCLSVEQANELFERTRFFENLVLSCFLNEEEAGQALCLPNDMELTVFNPDMLPLLQSCFDDKDMKDRLRTWWNGTELPSFRFVMGIDSAADHALSDESWRMIKWGVISSRFVRYIQTSSTFTNVSFLHAKAFLEANRNGSTNYHDFCEQLSSLKQWYEAVSHTSKSAADKNEFEKRLTNLELAIEGLPGQIEAYHHLLWYKARYSVWAGELTEANEYYQHAFTAALYRDHSNTVLGEIIKESLLVAAHQTRPDLVFLKRLKTAQIYFFNELKPARYQAEDSGKYQVLANNEVEAYRSEFKRYFPDELCYPGIKWPVYEQKVGHIIEEIYSSEHTNSKRNKIEIGLEGGAKRKTTPLIYACLNNDVEKVEKLLESAASVNALSEVGESPLLIALANLDYSEPTSPLDDSIFNLVSEHAHSEKTLNSVSTRKMNFPLFAAVETGRPEIVKKVLSMSKDITVDLKGSIEYQTPLYACLGKLAMIKNPSKFKESFMSMPSEEAVNRLKPLFAGTNSPFNTELGSHLSAQLQDQRFLAMMDAIFERVKTRFPKPSSMRQIARILLNAGANPNTEVVKNGMRYTPLMLAAELNELQLFNKMIEQGGDWKKTYTVPVGRAFPKRAIDCLDIAEHFKSYDVVRYIQKNLTD